MSDDKIKEIINKYRETNFYEGIKEYIDDKIVIDFAPVRENILFWYDFKPNSNVLEICAKKGAITGLLTKKANKVVSITEDVEFVKYRYKDYNNLEIINNFVDKIEFNEKFDYVIFVGELHDFCESFSNNKLDFCFNYLKILLKENGKILFSITNSLGLNINNRLNEQEVIYTKNDFLDIFNKVGFKNVRNYYPLPNQYFTQVIYTDDYLPTSDDILNSYNTNYFNVDYILYDEKEKLRKYIINNSFDIVTNSYLFEISNEDLELNKVNFISSSLTRKDEYRIITKLYSDKANKVAISNNKILKTLVEKNKLLTERGLNTINEYFINENTTQSEMEESPLYIYELSKLFEKDISLFKEKFVEFKDLVLKTSDILEDKSNTVFEKFGIKVSEKLKDEMIFLKDGYLDFIVCNAFYKNDKLFFFDQEWIEGNVPLKFILYRNVVCMFLRTRISNYITFEEMLNLYEITTEEVEIFIELEKQFQLEVISFELTNYFNSNQNRSKLKDYVKYLEDIKVEKEKIYEEYVRSSREYEIVANNYNELAAKYNELVLENNELKTLYDKLVEYENLSFIQKILKKYKEDKK